MVKFRLGLWETDEPKLVRVIFFAILLVILTIPLSIPVNNISSGLLIVAVLFKIFKEGYFQPQDRLFLAFSFLLFGIHFLPFLTSDNDKSTVDDLVKKVSLVIFPLLFSYIPPLSDRQGRFCLDAFIGIVLVLSLLTFRNGFFFGWITPDAINDILVPKPYLGMYAVTAIVFSLLGLKGSGFGKRIYYWLSAITLLAFLVLIVMKMALITVTICIFLLIVYCLFRYSKAYLLGFCALNILGVILLVGNSPDTQTVLLKILNFETFSWDQYNSTVVNTINIRFVLWKCSYLVAQEIDIILGVGKDTAKLMLIECYKEVGGDDFFMVRESMTPHNQLLLYLLYYGLTGVFVFLSVLVFFFLKAIYTRNIYYFFFLLIITLSCLTESILSVQKGIVFFSVFNSFLYFNFRKNKEGM